MGKSKKEDWKEKYRESVLEEKNKSDDDFEKYITYISSGGLALTVTFIDKISPLETSKQIWIIALGWVFLTFTLFINLLSHYLSSRYNEKTANEVYDEPFAVLSNNIECRNKIISCLNLSSIISLGIGILLILIFIIINAYNHG